MNSFLSVSGHGPLGGFGKFKVLKPDFGVARGTGAPGGSLVVLFIGRG